MPTCGALLAAGLLWLVTRPTAAEKHAEFDLVVALSGAKEEYSRDTPCFLSSGSRHPLSALDHEDASDDRPAPDSLASCACRCASTGRRRFAVFATHGSGGCFCTDSIKKVGFAAPNKAACKDTSLSVRLVADIQDETPESLGCPKKPTVKPAVKVNLPSLRRVLSALASTIGKVTSRAVEAPNASRSTSRATSPRASVRRSSNAEGMTSGTRRGASGGVSQRRPDNSDTIREKSLTRKQRERPSIAAQQPADSATAKLPNLNKPIIGARGPGANIKQSTATSTAKSNVATTASVQPKIRTTSAVKPSAKSTSTAQAGTKTTSAAQSGSTATTALKNAITAKQPIAILDFTSRPRPIAKTTKISVTALAGSVRGALVSDRRAKKTPAHATPPVTSSRQLHNNVLTDVEKTPKKTAPAAAPGNMVIGPPKRGETLPHASGQKTNADLSKTRPTVLVLRPSKTGEQRKKGTTEKKAERRRRNLATGPPEKPANESPLKEMKRSSGPERSPQKESAQPTPKEKTLMQMKNSTSGRSKKDGSMNSPSRIIQGLAQRLANSGLSLSPAAAVSSPRQKAQQQVQAEIKESRLPSAFKVSELGGLPEW